MSKSSVPSLPPRTPCKIEYRMDRRGFLRNSTLTGLFAAASCQLPSRDSTHTGMPAAFVFEEMTIAQLQEAMASGRLTARSLTEVYLSRIEQLDRQGPALRSLIEVNPQALEIAEALDRERAEKGIRGPLHGIPIVLKDNIDTADRMTTTAGSLALEGSIPRRDSFAAERLRASGAILLAKANLSEWANFRSERSSSGWSARGGQCRNPYVLDRNPCGSSSGSAVAVSANLCAASIGTETDGSIVCPSHANGLVGLKPTVGLISRFGIIPIAHSQDTAGPMSRSVADAAVLLGILAGVDPRDEATASSQGRFHADYTQFLDASGLRGARLGVARQFFGFHDRVDAVMAEALSALEAAGAILEDPVELPARGQFSKSEYEVLLYEFKSGLNSYLSALGPLAPVRSLAEIIRFNEENRERELPFFGQEIFLKAQEKGPLDSKEYLEALQRNHDLTRTQGIDKVMDEHRLDALIAPTGGPAWTTDLVNGDHFLGGSSSLAAVAGYPNITVPAGFIHGLPVGISFFGRAWSEPALLRLAYAFEQATRVRRPPGFITSL
jgi:amidase